MRQRLLIPRLGSRTRAPTAWRLKTLAYMVCQTPTFRLQVTVIMSAPQDSTAATGKVDQKPAETPKDIQKPTAALEEDDEFEDFPVEGEWTIRCFKACCQQPTS